MKIKENYLHEALKSNRDDKPSRADEARRQNLAEKPDAAHKTRQTDSPIKDELKFSDLLDSPDKLQKPNRNGDDASKNDGDERKNDKKHEAREKDSTENAAGDGKTEKYESAGGQTGGQSGFGMGANVQQSSLSDNFTARSILHIADLERLISTVRTQIGLGGRREIVLRLKRSVLDGLSVRITTDAAGVQIEFLAANEKVRSQVDSHAEELAGILRGRGINLATLKTSVGAHAGEKENSAAAENTISGARNESDALSDNDSLSDNTFGAVPPVGDKIFNA